MHTNVALRPPFNANVLPGPSDLESIALLLDVDGTILDTASTPGSVVVPESLRSSLKELHAKCGGALALVSGRLIRDLDNLFAPLRLPAIGGHGAEIRLEDKSVARARHADAIGEECRKLVAAEAGADSRVLLEDKGSSLAVHYRAAPQLEQTLKAKIAAIIARIADQDANQDLEVMHGKAVIEIKSTHFNKGAAVCEMMKSPPFLHRTPVFIGDDVTDETVFALLPTLGGIGYSVERLMPGANGTFGSPHEVRGWLAGICGREGNDRR
jgi:trehalose 6-phosphate phosphatase